MKSLAVAVLVLAASSRSEAGELDLHLGLQATTTQWDNDHGGGPTFGASWMFRPWIGINVTTKQHHVEVDDRFATYLSLNAIVRTKLGERLRLSGLFGLVHEHDETQAAIDAMPLESAFGVADGIRHRMASRVGAQLALPFRERAKGDWYVALDVDATAFPNDNRGPRWMASAGFSVGLTHDFARGGK